MADCWARTRILIGDQGVLRLESARVLIVGLGGVGSFAAEGLARAGIGTIDLVDFDKVETSNLNRQLVALTSNVGRYKSDILEERIRDINPGCDVHSHAIRCDSETIDDLLSFNPDHVVDAIDSVEDKVLLIQTCLQRSIPIISAMGTGNRMDPSQFQVADISKTHTCPLARRVRKELGRLGIQNGLKVVFSKEQPHKNGSGTTIGSISFVPSSAGLIIAGEVIKNIIAPVEGQGLQPEE